ncbi:platelet-activating factor receptor [Polypterus senegalus]
MDSMDNNATALELFVKYENDSCHVDSSFRYITFTVFYSLIFIVGGISNCYVLWVFTDMYPLKGMNDIKIYMINLTVADLLFLITLPLWIYYYHNLGNWTLPSFLCNLAGFLFFVNTYCSVAFLTVISYNRYHAVTKPLEAAQSSPRFRGLIISLIIWLVIAASASPYLFMESLNKDGSMMRCFEGYTSNEISVAITHLIIIALFFIVFILIIFCNLLIIRTLLSQSVQTQVGNRGAVKQRALWMVCAVLLVFIICFVPHHLIDGPWTMAVLGLWKKGNCDLLQSLNDLHQVTLLLMGLNCTLDPILYCFATKKFRRHLTERIRNMGSRKCSKSTTVSGISFENHTNGHPLFMENLAKE